MAAGSTSARRVVRCIVVPVVIGALWLGLRINALGDPSALLSNGAKNPANALVQREIPDAYTVPGVGFDGAQFYAIARGPFAWERTSRYLDVPSYRLRRILYPLGAGALAPGGGLPLVWSMALMSLVGIAIGGWWLDALPGAPTWLPLIMVLNPGVLWSLFASLSDALAAGLVLAAFGAMFTKRVRLAVVFLVLACLTRETSAVAAVALGAPRGCRSASGLRSPSSRSSRWCSGPPPCPGRSGPRSSRNRWAARSPSPSEDGCTTGRLPQSSPWWSR